MNTNQKNEKLITKIRELKELIINNKIKVKKLTTKYKIKV